MAVSSPVPTPSHMATSEALTVVLCAARRSHEERLLSLLRPIVVLKTPAHTPSDPLPAPSHHLPPAAQGQEEAGELATDEELFGSLSCQHTPSPAIEEYPDGPADQVLLSPDSRGVSTGVARAGSVSPCEESVSGSFPPAAPAQRLPPVVRLLSACEQAAESIASSCHASSGLKHSAVPHSSVISADEHDSRHVCEPVAACAASRSLAQMTDPRGRHLHLVRAASACVETQMLLACLQVAADRSRGECADVHARTCNGGGAEAVATHPLAALLMPLHHSDAAVPATPDHATQAHSRSVLAVVESFGPERPQMHATVDTHIRAVVQVLAGDPLARPWWCCCCSHTRFTKPDALPCVPPACAVHASAGPPARRALAALHMLERTLCNVSTWDLLLPDLREGPLQAILATTWAHLAACSPADFRDLLSSLAPPLPGTKPPLAHVATLFHASSLHEAFVRALVATCNGVVKHSTSEAAVPDRAAEARLCAAHASHFRAFVLAAGPSHVLRHLWRQACTPGSHALLWGSIARSLSSTLPCAPSAEPSTHASPLDPPSLCLATFSDVLLSLTPRLDEAQVRSSVSAAFQALLGHLAYVPGAVVYPVTTPERLFQGTIVQLLPPLHAVANPATETALTMWRLLCSRCPPSPLLCARMASLLAAAASSRWRFATALAPLPPHHLSQPSASSQQVCTLTAASTAAAEQFTQLVSEVLACKHRLGHTDRTSLALSLLQAWALPPGSLLQQLLLLPLVEWLLQQPVMHDESTERACSHGSLARLRTASSILVSHVQSACGGVLASSNAELSCDWGGHSRRIFLMMLSASLPDLAAQRAANVDASLLAPYSSSSLVFRVLSTPPPPVPEAPDALEATAAIAPLVATLAITIPEWPLHKGAQLLSVLQALTSQFSIQRICAAPPLLVNGASAACCVSACLAPLQLAAASIIALLLRRPGLQTCLQALSRGDAILHEEGGVASWVASGGVTVGGEAVGGAVRVFLDVALAATDDHAAGGSVRDLSCQLDPQQRGALFAVLVSSTVRTLVRVLRTVSQSVHAGEVHPAALDVRASSAALRVLLERMARACEGARGVPSGQDKAAPTLGGELGAATGVRTCCEAAVSGVEGLALQVSLGVDAVCAAVRLQFLEAACTTGV